VYLVRKNSTYDLALGYLKSPSRRNDFAQIVCALRNGKPLPEKADLEMVRAAKAILDPALGNSAVRIAWNAMLSPDARNAALTRAYIASEALLLGKAAGSLLNVAVHDPPFEKAQVALTEASAALRNAKDPAERAALQAVIGRANEIITKSYFTEGAKELIKQRAEDIFKRREEKLRTVPPQTPSQ
jgi:hypothetical protein